MALKCGLNSRTYEPKGDGFAPDLAVALMVAVAAGTTGGVKLVR